MMSLTLIILVCVVGISVLAGLGVMFWLASQPRAKVELPPQPQKISSPDGNLEARIQKRPDGNFQVEIYRWEQEDIPGMGVVETWRLSAGPSLFPTLAEAVQFSRQQVHISSEGFDD